MEFVIIFGDNEDLGFLRKSFVGVSTSPFDSIGDTSEGLIFS